MGHREVCPRLTTGSRLGFGLPSGKEVLLTPLCLNHPGDHLKRAF